MKKIFALGALTIAFGSMQAMAHHPAADIVDADVYAMIESMVADTPHATMELEEMGASMTRTTITAPSMEALDALVEEQGLVEYVSELDGFVNVNTSFNYDGSVTITIKQLN